MNALSPLKAYETHTRFGLMSLSRGPPSLPPSCSLPPLPQPSTSSPPAAFRRRNRTSSSSPFFHSSSTTSIRRTRQQCHPLTQNTRLQPLTPIYSTTTTPSTTSTLSQTPSTRVYVEPSQPQDQTCTEKDILAVKDAKEDEEEQLELNWRSMLEMFPRPRTYSQTAKHLANQRMGMMGSAA